jgi:hypothetical protein
VLTRVAIDAFHPDSFKAYGARVAGRYEREGTGFDELRSDADSRAA